MLSYEPNRLPLNYATTLLFSPCSNAIFAHLIKQTNATSGVYPVAFFKMSLRCNQWSKSNKINRIYTDHLTYITYEN